MTRTVLRGARWPGDVAFADGRIVAVGTVPAEDGDRAVRVDGDLITPGFVNTHHHFYQWLTRGWALDCGLTDWLQALYPLWSRVTPEDIGAAAAVACAELVLSGCTTTADHTYVVPAGDDSGFDAIAEAARAIGVRLHLGRGSMDIGQSRGGMPPDGIVEDRDAILSSTERLVKQWHDGETVSVVVAPCSPFTVSAGLMRESADLARRHGLRLHTHLAETLDEVETSVEQFGMRPVDYLDSVGMLAADVWVAHGIHFTDAEVAAVGRAGLGVAHCPSSNCRLASGIARVGDLEAAGAPVGLGVDGPASNEIGALLPELRMATFLARQRSLDAASFMPGDALRLATTGGARCLGRSDIAALKPGLRADLVVWPGQDLADVRDPLSGLVFGPARTARHVFVGGRAVVQDGALLTADRAALHADLARRARRLAT